MSVVKKFKELLDLDEIDVLIDEVGTSRHIIVSDFPDVIPQGKSSFLIEASPYIRENTEFQIDCIDSDGNSIYTEVVDDYLEGTARRVSLEVYSDVAPGTATLIIVGELDSVPIDATQFSDSEPVPSYFAGHYNVRLIKEFTINTTIPNTLPIKFFTQPSVHISEDRRGTMIRTEATSFLSSSRFNIEGLPTDTNLLFQPFGAIDEDLTVQGDLKGESETSKPKKEKNVQSFIEQNKLKNKKGIRKNSVAKRAGLVTKKNSPIDFPYLLKIGEFDGNETFTFGSHHLGGTVNFFTASSAGAITTTDGDGNTVGQNLFNNQTFYSDEELQSANLNRSDLSFDITKIPSIINQSPSFYSASIVEIVNEKTVLVDVPFTNKNVEEENIVLPIFGQGQVVFEALPTASNSEVNLISHANVQLHNLRTFSGDVFKTKIYAKPEGGLDDYTLVADVPLEGNELLVDNNSVSTGERTGYFISQSDSDIYYDTFGGANGLNQMPAASALSVSASYNNNVLIDSVQLSGSLASDVRFQLKNQYQFDLRPEVDYNLSFNAVGNVGLSDNALLMVYVSGSSMKPSKELFFDEFGKNKIQEPGVYGKRIGVLRVDAADEPQKDFGLVETNFASDVSGSGIIQFRNVTGRWNISDISIQPANDIGFSPSFFTFLKEMPSNLQQKRPEKFEFLVEFYDINNNISETIIYQPNVNFEGSNLSITGTDNVISGDLFLGGDSTSSGVHFGGKDSVLPETGEDGATGSGFLRSVGYQGFISASAQSGSYGFMMYSGSVLPDSGDNYNGVGLELVGESGSFKFRTQPSLFDVRADSFFVGRQDIQFISGSGGNIEISSSDFHLTPGGEVTASSILLGSKSGGQFLQFVGNQLTVQGNLSVDNIRTPSTIAGSPSTAQNASSSIDSSGFAKFVSASVGGWTVNESQIRGGNLILGKEGFIRSTDYVNDQSGFIITAQENGYAEFENIKVRGTLATTTFEKESVNAVGGQLFVANSTAITGSGGVAAEVTATSMSVVNATGFAAGEVLLIKKVDNTGFNTEYVRLVSSSFGSGDPDNLSGEIFVERGLGSQPYRLNNFFHVGQHSGSYISASAVPLRSGSKYHHTGIGGGNPIGADMSHNLLITSSMVFKNNFTVNANSATIKAVVSSSLPTGGSGVNFTLMEGDNTAQTKNAAGDYEKIFIVPRSFYDGFGANPAADKVSVHLIVSESTANNATLFNFNTTDATVDTPHGSIILSGNDGRATGHGAPSGGGVRSSSNEYIVRFAPTFTDKTAGVGLGNNNAGTDSEHSNMFGFLRFNGNATYDIRNGVQDENVSGGGPHPHHAGDNFEIHYRRSQTFCVFQNGKRILDDIGDVEDPGTAGASTTFRVVGQDSDSNGFKLDYCFIDSGDGVAGSLVPAGAGSVTEPKGITISNYTASLSAIDQGTTLTAQLGESGSVGDPIGGLASYTEGQVLVSTGRHISGTGENTVGTGYMRLNANPNNKATPYIDIVERTGSGIYDVALKARLGDLSGVAGTRNVPSGFTGFGLMSEVAFLSGSQIKLETPEFILGDINANYVSGSNGNLEISSSGYHLKPAGDAVFAGGLITFEQSGDITSKDFLIERSRLFGFGADGTVVMSTGDYTVADGGNGSGTKASSTSFTDANGGTGAFTRSSATYTLGKDLYFFDLTIDSSVILKTNGFRLFVFGTLTNNGHIHNDGGDGGNGAAGAESNGVTTGGTAGAASATGTLRGGVAGVAGGNGAEGSVNVIGQGGAGGGSGGCGGIVLIYAKIITGTGVIRANGGDGGNGGQGGPGNSGGGDSFTIPTGTVGSGIQAASFDFTIGPAAGGTGGASAAITRIDVIDPHIVQMVRDVMDSAETAARLRPGAGAGSGGGGHSAVTKGAGSINQGSAGNDGTDETLCINSGTGAAGGTAGKMGASTIASGNSACGGGGGGGGTGGVLIVCTTSNLTAVNNAGMTTLANGGAAGSGGSGGTEVSSNGVGGTGQNGQTGRAGKIIWMQV